MVRLHFDVNQSYLHVHVHVFTMDTFQPSASLHGANVLLQIPMFEEQLAVVCGELYDGTAGGDGLSVVRDLLDHFHEEVSGSGVCYVTLSLSLSLPLPPSLPTSIPSFLPLSPSFPPPSQSKHIDANGFSLTPYLDAISRLLHQL